MHCSCIVKEKIVLNIFKHRIFNATHWVLKTWLLGLLYLACGTVLGRRLLVQGLQLDQDVVQFGQPLRPVADHRQVSGQQLEVGALRKRIFLATIPGSMVGSQFCATFGNLCSRSNRYEKFTNCSQIIVPKLLIPNY
jgi:hypothetical protein